MKRLAACLLLLVPGFAAFAADDPEPPNSAEADVKKLQGTWDVEKAVKGGMDDSKQLKDKGAHAVIKDRQFFFVEGKGGREEGMKFSVAPKKRPAEMDIMDGRVTVKAIYKLEKDQLTIAFNEPGNGGGERPKSFDKAQALLVLKRRPVKK